MCQYSAVEGYIQDWHLQHHARFALGGVRRRLRRGHGASPATAASPMAAPACGRTARSRAWRGSPTCIASTASCPGSSSAMPAAGPACHGPGRATGRWLSAVPTRLGRRSGRAPCPSARAIRYRASSTAAEIDGSGRGVRRRRGASAPRRLRPRRDPRRPRLSPAFVLLADLQPARGRVRRQPGAADARCRSWSPRRCAPPGPTELPLFYRVSSVDGVEGGVTIEDTVALARALKERGIDVIDCSSGGMSGPATLSTRKIRQGYQVPYAEAVRRGRRRRDHGRGCDHLAGAGRVRAGRRPAPTWSRSAAS